MSCPMLWGSGVSTLCLGHGAGLWCINWSKTSHLKPEEKLLYFNQQSWEHPLRALRFPWKKKLSAKIDLPLWSMNSFCSWFYCKETAKILYSFVNFIKRCLFHMYSFKQGRALHCLQELCKERQAAADTSAKRPRNMKNHWHVPSDILKSWELDSTINFVLTAAVKQKSFEK